MGRDPAWPLLPASRRWVDVPFDFLHAVESSGPGQPLKPIIIWAPDTAGALGLQAVLPSAKAQ
jgi:hypothetical protein